MLPTVRAARLSTGPDELWEYATMLFHHTRRGARRRLRRTAVATCAITAGLTAALVAPAFAAADPTSPAGLTNAPMTATVTYLLKQMTVDEKLLLVHGGLGFTFPPFNASDPNLHGQAGYVAGIPRLGIPEFREADAQGINVFKDATAYPGRLGLAASFDRSALTQFGQAAGNEGRALDVDLVYGPQVDLARFPSWYRNMTTYGEDPYLSSQLTGDEINGIQSTGLLSQVKHVAFYNGQNQSTPSIVDDQAAQELYLPASEAAVKDGHVSSIMCSLATFQITPVENQPDYACSNAGLLTTIIRQQWGFDGFITSDYNASTATSDLLKGLNQEFVSTNLTSDKLKPLVDPTSPSYSADYATALNQADSYILYQYQRFGLLNDKKYPARAKTGVTPRAAAPAAVDKQAGINTARQLADQTGVLLKNDSATLPLSTAENQKIAVIGPTANLVASAPGGERSRGFGDRNLITPLKAMQQQSGGAVINYAPGIDRIGNDVPASALATDTAPGSAPGLTRTDTDANGNVVTTIDTTVNGKQTTLVAGHKYTWSGYLNVPTTDTWNINLQRSVGVIQGSPTGYNNGVNPGLQVGPYITGQHPVSLAVDGTSQTLVAPSTVLPNSYPNGQTLNGQYLGLDGTAAAVPLTAGQHKIQFTYSPPANAATTPVIRLGWSGQQANIDAAVAAVKGSNTAVVFVDDANTNTAAGNVSTLGPGQDALISAVTAANPNTAVVINSDAAVLMPWIGSVRSVLEMWYPGQEGGLATSDLLFGRVNPSGKLPMTFPSSNSTTPFAGHPERASGVNGQVVWSEKLDVGYRWYSDNNVTTLFPFGYGLSYTSFKYSGLTLTPTSDGGIDASVTVGNNGTRAGSTVVQFYVGRAASLPADISQTSTKLVQFGRVTLAPKAKQVVTVHIAPRELSSWSTAQQTWVLGAGPRTITVGTSAATAALTGRTVVAAN